MAKYKCPACEEFFEKTNFDKCPHCKAKIKKVETVRAGHTVVTYNIISPLDTEKIPERVVYHVKLYPKVTSGQRCTLIHDEHGVRVWKDSNLKDVFYVQFMYAQMGWVRCARCGKKLFLNMTLEGSESQKCNSCKAVNEYIFGQKDPRLVR